MDRRALVTSRELHDLIKLGEGLAEQQIGESKAALRELGLGDELEVE
jgi:hypothetical protein